MQKILIAVAALLFFGYYSYTVFLADDALIKRSETTKDAKGNYQIKTKLLDGSHIVEAYEVHDNVSPKSHSLAKQGSEPGAELKNIKPPSTFKPKFKS
jgi:hypothetical protein